MKNVNVPKHDAAKTKSVACDFEWFSELFMQIDVSALVRSVCFFAVVYFILFIVGCRLNDTVSFIANI